jgi:hypothetical protein
MPKDRAKKLRPLFIGLFTILQALPEQSSYQLDLPQKMSIRRIHSVFHVWLLCPFVANNQNLFPKHDANYYYNYGALDNNKWVIEEIIGHRWNGRAIEFNVRWSLGDTTWEPLEHCDKLQALDEYLILMNAKDWQYLSKKATSNNTHITTNSDHRQEKRTIQKNKK